MICENCGSSKESRVLESRERQGFTYRLRKCMSCGFEYVTHEKYFGPAKANQPRILFLAEAEKWAEAVWLEYRVGRFIATSISGITETAVFFGNGMSASRKTCLHEWRMWTKRPTETQRRDEQWQ